MKKLIILTLFVLGINSCVDESPCTLNITYYDNTTESFVFKSCRGVYLNSYGCSPAVDRCYIKKFDIIK